VVTLGCARNEVDSEELAGRLSADGYELVDDAEGADAVLVNTCGFIETAKKDSVDAILAATDSGASVVAVGCMAERYGSELAGALPEATVLGFDDYGAIGDRLDDVLAGRPLVPHTPRDRRTLLPISPVDRTAVTATADAPAIPGHDWLRRKRLASGPTAALKLASGCDRRCAFCAIPTFRGAFVSRPPAEVLGEAQWLASQGVTELVLVSENSTSYGKDLGDLRSLEKLLPELGAIEGIVRVRVAYLQPAELRPGLLEVIAGAGGGLGAVIAPYFDLSFQHSSPTLLRRMRRFGGTDDFLTLIDRARSLAPTAGFRTNVILGFPGETEDDVAELERFLTEGRLDAVGVFGYSDEEGTEAMTLPGKLDQAEIDARVRRITDLVEELTAQRAEDRIGERVEVLLTEDLSAEEGPGVWAGHAAHQDPDSDGTTTVAGVPADAVAGQILAAEVVGTEGIDLVARALTPAGVAPAGSGAAPAGR
jgi:ribosomal protein S12 methylthiotransferase RimO